MWCKIKNQFSFLQFKLYLLIKFLQRTQMCIFLYFKLHSLYFKKYLIESSTSRKFGRYILQYETFCSMMWSSFLGVVVLSAAVSACTPSLTTVSGTHAPITVCSGALIFADDFEEFDLEKWQHENTLSGGGVSLFSIIYF